MKLLKIFQFQWKIGNISDTFLQYSVLCGALPRLILLKLKNETNYAVNTPYYIVSMYIFESRLSYALLLRDECKQTRLSLCLVKY